MECAFQQVAVYHHMQVFQSLPLLCIYRRSLLKFMPAINSMLNLTIAYIHISRLHALNPIVVI